MADPMPRFVLLHHVLSDSEHWDLMLDLGTALATWRLRENPALLSAGGGPGSRQPARRIADHRRAYLDYEGPVSGNRGRVERVDAGHYLLIEQDPARWVVRLAGTLLAGVYRVPVALEPGEMALLTPAPREA